MDTSPGDAIIISLVLAIVLSACPAACAYSLPVGGTMAPDLIAGVPGLSDNGPVSQVHAVDQSFNGKTVHVARGDVLLVQLQEYNPDQSWHFSDSGGFKVIDDAALQTYPMQHNFRVKAFRPGDLSFRMIDRRDGTVTDTFSIRVFIDSKEKGSNCTTAHPLQMARTIVPG